MKIGLLVGIVALLAIATLLVRRRGYGVGGETIVRCRQGHLFTTLWIPGASIKSIRLGWVRFQFCPVGRHWTMVVPVKESELTDEQKRLAREQHDLRLP